ncbi:MAG: DUF4825 domain-containing protein [Butyrivibrio sp.]
MENKLSCNIVKDLLPSYVDGLVSEETKEAVETHMKECPECRKVMKDMTTPKENTEENLKEVDYLKKVRRKGKITGRICIIIGILLILLSQFLMFRDNNIAQLSDIDYSIGVEGKTICFTVKATGSMQRVSRVKFTRPNGSGVVDIEIYMAPKLFLGNEEREFTYTIDSDYYDVEKVEIGENVIWADGMLISNKASALYRAHNPYMGDMPANAELAGILGVSEQFGNYTNELRTSAKPYGWILKLQDEIPVSKKELSVELMRADSCIFLAMIGNLDYVTWEYQTETGPETFEFSKEDADELCGKDIKQFVEDVSDVQILLDMLGIK